MVVLRIETTLMIIEIMVVLPVEKITVITKEPAFRATLDSSFFLFERLWTL